MTDRVLLLPERGVDDALQYVLLRGRRLQVFDEVVRLVDVVCDSDINATGLFGLYQ